MFHSSSSHRSTKNSPAHTSRSGFSLVQLVLTVAIVAIVSSIGVISITQYRSAAIDQKLRSDVAALNNASRVFLSSGGNFTGATTADEVLARLKTTQPTEAIDEVVGLRGSMIDPRLAAVALETEEESSDSLRARWNANTQTFELMTSGAGIKEFTLTATSGRGTHRRETAVQYSKEDDWIWDYTDRDSSRPSAPIDATLISPNQSPPTAGVPESAVALSPPTISVPGGTYPLVDYPMEIAIAPGTGNPADTVIFFSVDSGSTWEVYTEPFTINPAVEVAAYSASSDPDNYVDSAQISEEYPTTAVQLEFALESLKESYTYAELGGALMADSPDAPPQAEAVSFELLNSASIPLAYQNSNIFEINYSYDGTDPLSDPANSIAGDPFTNGFPGQSIPVNLAAFGSSNTLPIQAVGRSLNTAVVQDSEVENVVITGEVTTLTPPEITVDATSGEVSLELVLESADVPEGAYIYYSIDGTDPGVGLSGDPVEGQLYTSPFTPEADVQIIARVYPPAEIANWFDVSVPALETLIFPNYDVYIGGDFFLDGTTKSHRNIARLATDGLIDPGFDPGSGANAGSTVGAVLRQGSESILVSEDFQTMRGVVIPAIVRLDASGAIDGAFDAGLE